MRLNAAEQRFLEAALLVNGLCLALFAVRIQITGASRFWFIPQNIILAWAALLFAWLLTRRLRTEKWADWQSLLLTILWLAFLPNTWYVMTDLVHITPTGEISQLYDITLMTSLLASGFFAGFASLYLVHKQLLQRLYNLGAAVIVTLVIALCSFAIYMGRDLRWNSWDILANPAGLILNASDRLADPVAHPRTINVTLLFFLIIATGYAAIWRLSKPKN